jgi:pilus assembly protein CpaE
VVLAVYGARADVGVTTVASSLARALLALALGEVALAELDPRVARARAGGAPVVPGDSLATSNGRGGPAAGQVEIPGADAGMSRRRDGVWMLAAGGPRPAVFGDAKSVTVALDAMRAAFAVSVAELEHQMTERTLAAFDAADRILLVTEGSVPSLRATQRVLRLCRRLNYPDEKMCVVANRADAPGTLASKDISAALKRELFWTIPHGPRMELGGLAAKLVTG